MTIAPCLKSFLVLMVLTVAVNSASAEPSADQSDGSAGESSSCGLLRQADVIRQMIAYFNGRLSRERRKVSNIDVCQCLSKLHSSAAERRKPKALGVSPRESSITEPKAPDERQHSR